MTISRYICYEILLLLLLAVVAIMYEDSVLNNV